MTLFEKKSAQPGILAGIHQLRFADGHEHALGSGGVGRGIVLADVEVFLEGVFLFPRLDVSVQVLIEYSHGTAAPL